MTPERLCQGLGMPICDTCNRNTDNHPNAKQDARWLIPAANPPKCMDWQALPIRAMDASHSRL